MDENLYETLLQDVKDWFYLLCRILRTAPEIIRVEVFRRWQANCSDEAEKQLAEMVAVAVFDDEFWELVTPQLKGGDTLTNQKTHDRQAEGVIQ